MIFRRKSKGCQFNLAGGERRVPAVEGHADCSRQGRKAPTRVGAQTRNAQGFQMLECGNVKSVNVGLRD